VAKTIEQVMDHGGLNEGAYRVHRWAAVILFVVWILIVWIGSEDGVAVLLLGMFSALGFLPTFIAGMRRYVNGIAIFVLNLFLFYALGLLYILPGMTFMNALALAVAGWMIVLVWSLISTRGSPWRW
jgi:hypothetical protein